MLASQHKPAGASLERLATFEGESFPCSGGAAALDDLRAVLSQEGPRLVFLGGKGGVGKTTLACAAALAIAEAAPGRRVLLASTDPAHSLGDALEFPLGPQVVRVPSSGNLSAQEISAEAELGEFLSHHDRSLRQLIARGFLMDEEDLSPFFQLTFPGLDEVMGVLTLVSGLTGSGYDRIVVDTAPTGHTLRLLQLPRAMAGWTEYLDRLQQKHRLMRSLYSRSSTPDLDEQFLANLSSRLGQLRQLLSDPGRCRFLVVCNPEPMSLAETQRLVRELRVLGIPIGPLLVNKSTPRGGCPDCIMLEGRERVAAQVAGRLRRLGAFVSIPYWQSEPRGLENLRKLARSLACSPEDDAGASRNWAACGPGTAQQLEALASTEEPESVCLPPLPHFIRVLMFGGKGGVGKTTAACAYALHHARRYPNRRVLLLSTDPAHSLSDFFGTRVGTTPRPWLAQKGLHVQELSPEQAFARLKATFSSEVEQLLDSLALRAGIDLPGERQALIGLMELVPPGLDEMMALASIAEHLDAGHFDLYVVDTAPTGHALRLLELPQVALEWLRNIFSLLLRYRDYLPLRGVSATLVSLSRRLRLLQQVLTDPARTRFVVVTNPTRVALAETGRLMEALGRILVECHGILLNRYPGRCPCYGCLQRLNEAPGVLRAARVLAGARPLVIVPEVPGGLSASTPGPLDQLAVPLGLREASVEGPETLIYREA